MHYNSLKIKKYRNRYPYPYHLLTPLYVLLFLVAIEAAHKLTWQDTQSFFSTAWAKVTQGNLFKNQEELDRELAAISTQAVDNTPQFRSLFNADKLKKFSKARPSNNLWDHIRQGLDLNGYEHVRVDKQLNWYARSQSYLNRVVDRASPYLYYIYQEIKQRGMPTELALLPVVESAFQPFAFSAGRAAGIWQFIPATGFRYGLKQNWWYDGRRDIYASTNAALDLLQDLGRMYNGDWLLALAAYNAGPGTVNRAIKYNNSRGRATKYWDLKLPKETEDYVPKLLAIAAIIAEPETYKLKLKPIPHIPYFTRVATGGQLDLAKAADLADITIEELYRLNPAFNRWATAPDGPHYLLVPYENAELFADNIKKHPSEERIQWHRHVVKHKESLASIAAKAGTTTKTLMRINQLDSSKLSKGKNLVIPVAPKGLSQYLADLDTKNVDAKLTKNPKQKLSYTVRDGDTLWGIAQEYNVTLSKLAQWNDMSQDDVLFKGKKLVIMANSELQDQDLLDALIPTSFAQLPTRAITRKVNYRVRSGDSLASISQQFKVSMQQLRTWNKLTGEHKISPGQKLTLFVDVTRQSGKI